MRKRHIRSTFEGTWRHSRGLICCGTLRIAKEEFDTCPAEEFKTEIFAWLCETLNARNRGASK